ncbi:sec7 domain protein [Ichthyophthirius multifiliis]|uniref:Sec7 domain protein n=1 Tax=Ichthyophthirius multifiliis TaxID=5932 RepID=G0QX14_ICHMU|nr:sec7 domain protein [Ichthyophthirius multifiliis]EGR30237.1 sec7 domain protein [Ichthyophthirius multifiliis]|eukprot:XP_004031833.1 sec7 domain protein [Ichthyophthirius multifiliis]
MTGESQQVLRILDEFSINYYQQNQQTFLSSNSAYTFTCALIMLQSDLHSSKNEKKMLPEEFIKQVRGVNEGQDISNEYVLDCYYNIQSNEIKECRSFHISTECTIIIWKYMILNYQMFSKFDFLDDELSLIEQDEKLKREIAEKALLEMILKNIFENIDFIIFKFKETEEEEENMQIILESLINLCISNDKIDYVDKIFKNVR